MKFEFEIQYFNVVSKSNFCIGLKHRYGDDYFIARILYMSLKAYQDKLLEFGGIFFSNFNHRPDGNVFFECEEDVKRALEWVESAYIMSQLRE